MFTLPPLPYDYSALEPWIDTETMKIHHDKHHQAYVDNLNKLLAPYPELLDGDLDILTNLDKIPEEIRQKVRNNIGGHVNHTLFWTFMAPPTNQKMLADFAPLQEEFSAKALNRFGSGWAWLIKDGDNLKVVDTPNQDNPMMDNPKVKILLGLDVWEHAYYLKYQNRRKDYIEAWFNVVNWAAVTKRLAT